MLSGNLFSLSLGTSISVAAIAFLGLAPFRARLAIVLVLRSAWPCSRSRERSSGCSSANAIIVTIGAPALIQSGVVTWLTEGANSPSGSSTAYEQLGGELLGIPFGFYVLVVVAMLVEPAAAPDAVRPHDVLMGENRRAAHAAGLPVALDHDGAFAIAGFTAAAVGILLGAFNGPRRCRSAGPTPTTRSPPTLVGGNAIAGGRGSVGRACFGAIFIVR